MQIEKEGKIYSMYAGEFFNGPDTLDRILLEDHLKKLQKKDSMKYIPDMREAYGEILAKKIGGRLLPEMTKDDYNPDLIY